MVIVVGKVGKNPVIDKMVSNKILDVSNSTGKWETFDTQVVEKQFIGVDRALIIDGSDKRGTIFGIYDLCTHVGVSPWNWWAYVPPIKSKNLFVKARRSVQGEPIVKYRGIFLNDEKPVLGRWAVEKLGGFDHQFYTNLFELKLRMKGIICGQPGGRQVLTAIILSILILQMNINELYYSVGKNKMYASPGRASTNDLAAYAKVIFDLDSADSHYYNHEWANGKWNHMMDQTHIS